MQLTFPPPSSDLMPWRSSHCQRNCSLEPKGFCALLCCRFNLCKETVAETQQLCSEMLEQVFAPALKQPAEGFDQMSRSLLDAMWVMVPFLQYDAFLGFARRLSGVEAPLAARASLYSRVLLSYQVFVHEVVLCTALLAWLFRPILNFGMWFSVFMTQRLPLLAYVTFGRSHVY